MYLRVIGSAPGESILILFDTGEIITIDCCKRGAENYTVESIRELGLDFDKVIFNVLTHFHDDHIRGASELVQLCSKSRVVIPDAWTEDVFKSFVASMSADVTLGPSSVTKEIERIFDEVGGRGRMFPVSELTSLYPPAVPGYKAAESLLIMTPTVARKTNFLTSLAKEIKKGDAALYSFCETNKNWTSISCVLSTAQGAIFLGGDVENKHPDFDIKYIHDTYITAIARYDLVKLPHHGSDTSFCDEMRRLIDDKHTFVTITPYPRGHKILPDKKTRDYLSGAERVYVLSGDKVGLKRDQRMRRKNFFVEPVPNYRPGIFEFMDGAIETKFCKSLDEFLS